MECDGCHTHSEDAGSVPAVDICGGSHLNDLGFLAGACSEKGKGVRQLILPAAPGLLTNVLVNHLSPASPHTDGE